MRSILTWDIFCAVVDNFGDAGVCWRLARQLVHEHGRQVRLWVDDLPSLQRLCPEIQLHLPIQQCNGVEVRMWSQPFPDVASADVVIEAFGCELPENYLRAMAGKHPAPIWINLEYLSAESWVEGYHGLTSPHPRLPLTKHFFFPGFSAKTGGLLRERDLISRREALRENPGKLWELLGLTPPPNEESVVSLFCYDTAPITSLLDSWSVSASPVRCLLPEGKVLASVAAYFGKNALAPGDTVQHGNLTLQVLPFLRQEDYDLLLWACDFNFVRGEDSFVRAQWAARPMAWNIYPQQEKAHMEKLNAFLDLYCSGLGDTEAAAIRNFHEQWNNDGTPDWDTLRQHRNALQAHASAWATRLAAHTDLASNLVIFCKNRV